MAVSVFLEIGRDSGLLSRCPSLFKQIGQANSTSRFLSPAPVFFTSSYLNEKWTTAFVLTKRSSGEEAM